MKKFIIIAILAITAIPASAQSLYTFVYNCTKHYDEDWNCLKTTCDANLKGKKISFVWNSSTSSYEDVNIENTFCSFCTEDVMCVDGEDCYMGPEFAIIYGYFEYLTTDLSKYYYEDYKKLVRIVYRRVY